MKLRVWESIDLGYVDPSVGEKVKGKGVKGPTQAVSFPVSLRKKKTNTKANSFGNKAGGEAASLQNGFSEKLLKKFPS